MNAERLRLKKLSFYSKCFCVIGFSLSLTAIGSYFFADYMLQNQIYNNILIENNSKAFQFWKDPPAKIIRKYYLFNVTNPIEVELGTAKPRLVQCGPYTYSEIWEKRNVVFYGLELLSFNPVVTLFFEPSLSNGTENDPITFLNIPAVGMIENVMNGRTNAVTIFGVNLLFKLLKTQLFITKTATQLISGYEDPLMELAKVILPKIIKDSKFSLINGKNGTEWQNYTIQTGKEDIHKVAQIKTWDGVDELNFWDSDTANMINGSDGSFYPPFRTKDQILYAYSPDMCRSYNLIYLRDNNIKGIKTYDFHLPKNIFYNTTGNPNNIGFCGKDNKCLGNGVQNISSCYGGVSGFISQPHFLNADSKFREALVGLNPNESIHDFILHFEPTTGVPIGGNIRLQISFYMFQNKEIDLVKNIDSNLMPVVWFDESLELFDDTRKQLSQVALIARLCVIIPLILLCFGAFWILFSMSLYILVKYRQQFDYECIESDTESESKDDSKDDSKDSGSEEPNENTQLLNNDESRDKFLIN